MEPKLGVINQSSVKSITNTSDLSITKSQPQEQEINQTYVFDTNLLNILLDDMLHDVQKIAELGKQSLEATDNSKLRKKVNHSVAELHNKLKYVLPDEIVKKLDAEVHNCIKTISPTINKLIEFGNEATKIARKKRLKDAKLQDTKIITTAQKDAVAKLSEDERVANARLFTAVNMLKAALQVSKTGMANTSITDNSSSAQVLNTEALDKIVQQLAGDINSLINNLDGILEHFKNVVDSQVTPQSMNLVAVNSTDANNSPLGTAANTHAEHTNATLGSSANASGLTSTQLGSSATSTQVYFTAPENIFDLFKNMTMVAMMAKIFKAIDDAMVNAGAFFLQLSQQVQRLQSVLAPTINLITGLSSQMQTLLSGYQAANASNTTSPWQKAVVLGFGEKVNGNLRTLAADTSYGGYPIYQTGDSLGDDSLNLQINVLHCFPNTFLSNSIIEAYNSSTDKAADFPTLAESVGEGKIFPTIQDLVAALNTPDHGGNYFGAVNILNHNPYLLNKFLGNAPGDRSPDLNTGFYVKDLPQSLIDAAGGAIISGNSALPQKITINPSTGASTWTTVQGNWSIVTVSGLQNLIKNLSAQMHMIQIIDNGSSGGSSDQNGMLLDSFNALSSGSSGLNNQTLNDYVSNTLNSAATTLSTAQQDLSQFGEKLVNEPTQDILPLLQGAIQAFLKAFPS